MENSSEAQLPAGAYGFIGLGNMGYGMALNVRKKMPSTSTLVVCELDEAQRKEFCSEAKQYGKVETADTPKEVAERSNTIITSLPHGPAVSKVFTDLSTGLLAATKSSAPKVFLETSTIEVSTSLEVLKAVEGSGLGVFLDAPVSGGIPPAANGTLTFMVGGPKDLFKQASPVMSLMGTKLFHCGKAGAGLATKQINNYIAYCSYIALCEGMNTGLKYGLDPKVLNDVINASSGCCWNSLHMNPVKGVQPDSSASRDFKGGFKVELAKGVTDMAVQLMEQVSAKHVFGDVMKDIFARAVDNPLCAGQESRSVWRLFTEDDGNHLGKTKIE
ncbi:3-hydroxyisobutyrate dehydrogenase, mitochondrial [Pseudocercospora fuligena]|uniref:3-hydroxyisobutyrate dehydrogenase n=1 Tax=Pseudocercospora fuligena TaxID=685502 RepID=A0A8H6RDS7_9PEZI|nr:3-hydroxyisobutyrate dehydrogenase, mitochondrial [Pseudocercospora fuligena]